MRYLRQFLAILLISLCGVAHAQTIRFKTPYVTRAEAAMILIKMRLQTNIPALTADYHFPDVQPGAWYERYVVLAERYGVLEADPATGALRPEDAVHRSEFIKMTDAMFGLPLNLPYLYRDVSPLSWYAPYVGAAEKYHLFRDEADQSRFRADGVLTHGEVIRALYTLLRQLNAEALPTLESQEAAASEKRDRLGIYERISTQQGEVTFFGPSAPTLPPPLPPAPRPAYEDPSKIPQLRQEILERVNHERTIAGLQPLHRSAELENSAQRYADLMVEQNFFGHIDPDGRTLSQRIEESGYYAATADPSCYCLERYVVGENLARGQRSAQEAVDSWMRSESHRHAILTPEFSDIGVGINAGVWVQHFGGKKTVHVNAVQ